MITFLKRTILFIPAVLLFSSIGAQNVRHVTLDEAIAMGVKESKILRLSQHQVEYAQAKHDQAYDLAYPYVNVTGGYQRLSDVPPFVIHIPDEPPASIPTSFPDNTQAEISLHQIVFAGFRIKEAKEASTYELLASQSDYNRDDQETRLNIITAYYDLYKVQQAVPTIQANLDQISQRVKDMQNMASQGMATENDVLRIQLQQSNIQLLLINAQNTLKHANYNFTILIGLPNDVNIEIDTAGLFRQNIFSNDAGFIDTALRNRPEIRSIVLREQSLQSNLTASKNAYWPNISVDANYLVANPSPRYFPPQPVFNETWGVGVSLNWGLTNLFTNKHVIDEDQALLDAQKTRQDQLTDNIKSEVYQNYLAYKESLERLQVLEQANSQANANMTEIDSRYKNSIATISDLTDAQTQQIAAQINLIIGKADAQIDYQKLLKSTGKF